MSGARSARRRSDRAEAAATRAARPRRGGVRRAGRGCVRVVAGASAGYEALANLPTPESLAEDPGPCARACVALDAASARIEAGDARTRWGKHTRWSKSGRRASSRCATKARRFLRRRSRRVRRGRRLPGTPLEEADEARVAEIEATAEEARVVFDAGAPEEVATNADADIVAAHERATAEYEAAKVAVETAVAAREDALRARVGERAARA